MTSTKLKYQYLKANKSIKTKMNKTSKRRNHRWSADS